MGWPMFDEKMVYQGPLNRSPATTLLKGQSGDDFNTKQAASWPEQLCEHLAELVWRNFDNLLAEAPAAGVEEVVDEVVGKKVADTATELEERADVKEVAGQEAAVTRNVEKAVEGDFCTVAANPIPPRGCRRKLSDEDAPRNGGGGCRRGCWEEGRGYRH